jgi:hypothetical protein
VLSGRRACLSDPLGNISHALCITWLRDPPPLEAIVPIAGHDVEVKMEDILPRSFTTGMNEIHTIWGKRTPDLMGYPDCGSNHVACLLFSHLPQIGGVANGHHKCVSIGYRVDIHKCHGVLIRIYTVAGTVSGNDLAEDAGIVTHIGPPRPLNGNESNHDQAG